MQNKILKFTKQQWISWSIFIQSLLGVLGSLYYSNFGDPVSNVAQGILFDPSRAFEPCHLCWWARILLYPIAVISLVGIIKKDRNFTDYILPLSLLGILLEIYHYSLQMFPSGNSAFCTLDNPCSSVEVAYGGFITIPLLAGIAFYIITALCFMNRSINKRLQSL